MFRHLKEKRKIKKPAKYNQWNSLAVNYSFTKHKSEAHRKVKIWSGGQGGAQKTNMGLVSE